MIVVVLRLLSVNVRLSRDPYHRQFECKDVM
jgi:hypothetical protein